MTLYTTNPRWESHATFDVSLLPQFLVGVSCSREKLSWHIALHLGPLVIMFWRISL